MKAFILLALIATAAYADSYVPKWKALPGGRKIHLSIPDECHCDADGKAVSCPDVVMCVLVK
jgi:hypothetical protein